MQPRRLLSATPFEPRVDRTGSITYELNGDHKLIVLATRGVSSLIQRRSRNYVLELHITNQT